MLVPFTAFSKKLIDAGLVPGKPLIIQNVSFHTLEGFIEVPENYNYPKSIKIKLPVYIVKSSNVNPSEPVFWLDGGPGGSNILTAKKIIASNQTQLLNNHDLVCIGYRGVDGSVVLGSKNIRKAMKGLNNHLYSNESLDNIEKNVQKYSKELALKKIDINQYNVVNVANDIEFLRKQLGYKKINLLSISFGTRIALVFSRINSENLNRTLMIGAVSQGNLMVDPYGIEKYVEKYDSLYGLQKQVKYKGNIKEAIKIAFRNMPKKWKGFTLSIDKIKTGTVNSLYSARLAVLAFDSYFKAAYDNDYSGLFLFQKIYDAGRSNVVGDVFAKAVTAELTIKTEELYEREHIRKADTLLLGSNYALLYGGTYKSWNLKPIPASFQQSRKLSNEILIISGNLDFRTPAEITDRELMPYFERGLHLVLENSSHIDIFNTVMASPEFLKKYFTDGITDKTLLQTKAPIDFNDVIKVNKFKIWVMGVIK